MRLGLKPYWQLGLGGLIVGVVSIFTPQVWGNGYSVVGNILNGELVGLLLLAVLAAKVVATSATVGSGAVGGVFTPTLFIGSAVGALVGGVLHRFMPTFTSDPAAYALIGMGGFLAGGHDPRAAHVHSDVVRDDGRLSDRVASHAGVRRRALHGQGLSSGRVHLPWRVEPWAGRRSRPGRLAPQDGGGLGEARGCHGPTDADAARDVRAAARQARGEGVRRQFLRRAHRVARSEADSR